MCLLKGDKPIYKVVSPLFAEGVNTLQAIFKVLSDNDEHVRTVYQSVYFFLKSPNFFSRGGGH